MLKPIAALAASAMVLAACASSTSERLVAADYLASPALGEQVDRICFIRNIDGFGATTRSTVIVEEGVNDHYLIEVTGTCQDLDWAQSLAFSRTTGSCLTRFDRIVAFDSVFPDRSDARLNIPCTIRAIYEWDEDKLGEDGVTKVQDATEEDKDGETSETEGTET